MEHLRDRLFILEPCYWPHSGRQCFDPKPTKWHF